MAVSKTMLNIEMSKREMEVVGQTAGDSFSLFAKRDAGGTSTRSSIYLSF